MLIPNALSGVTTYKRARDHLTQVAQDRFMEFTQVENHDDYYSYDDNSDATADEYTPASAGGGDKRPLVSITASRQRGGADEVPHVQDQNGFYVVYDAAVKDFDLLEDELMLLGSHYIEKHVETGECVRA